MRALELPTCYHTGLAHLAIALSADRNDPDGHLRTFCCASRTSKQHCLYSSCPTVLAPQNPGAASSTCLIRERAAKLLLPHHCAFKVHECLRGLPIQSFSLWPLCEIRHGVPDAQLLVIAQPAQQPHCAHVIAGPVNSRSGCTAVSQRAQRNSLKEKCPGRCQCFLALV